MDGQFPTDPASVAARARAFLRGFPAIALAIFLAAIDQTVTSTALPAIAAEFAAVERISWVVVAYLIAATCAAPAFGQLGDALGRRNVLFLALAANLAGCLINAVAPSLPVLIAGRILQGVGGGGLLTLAMSLIGEALPPRERGRFQGHIAAIYASAAAFGPVGGGLLTEHFGWRAIFLVAPPIALLAALLALRLPKLPPARGTKLRFDWLGLALFILVVGPALIALDRARRMDMALLPLAALLGLLAALALVALLWWERRAPDPLLPITLLAEPSIWRTNLLSGCVYGAMIGCIAFLPIFLQAVRGTTPGEAGLIMLPLSVGGAIGAVIAGKLMGRTGRTMVWTGWGLAFATVFLALTGLFADTVPLGILPVMLLLAAIGFGTSFPISQTVVQVAAGPRLLGAAAASVQFSRNLGAALGTAILGAVLFGSLALAGGGIGGDFARIMTSPAALAGLAGGEAPALRDALVAAYRALFLTAAAFCAVGMLFSLKVPLRRV